MLGSVWKSRSPKSKFYKRSVCRESEEKKHLAQNRREGSSGIVPNLSGFTLFNHQSPGLSGLRIRIIESPTFLAHLLQAAQKKWLLERNPSLGNGRQRSAANVVNPLPEETGEWIGYSLPLSFLSVPGEITGDVIGSSIFCNRTQGG